MRARAAIAIGLVGLAACIASDVYLNAVDDYSSGVDFGLVAWNLLPFGIMAGVVAVSRVSLPAAALATLVMAAFVLFAFWAEAQDLQSDDPSSTGEIILAIGPFYDVVVIAVLCGVDAVVRRLHRR